MKCPISYFDKVYQSEDAALWEVISQIGFHKNNVRGLSNQQQLEGIMDRGVGLVGRVKANMAYVRCDSLSFSVPQADRDGTVEVIGDCLMNRMQETSARPRTSLSG